MFDTSLFTQQHAPNQCPFGPYLVRKATTNKLANGIGEHVPRGH